MCFDYSSLRKESCGGFTVVFPRIVGFLAFQFDSESRIWQGRVFTIFSLITYVVVS